MDAKYLIFSMWNFVLKSHINHYKNKKIKSHINLSYFLGKIDEEYSFLILSSCLLGLTLPSKLYIM